MLSPANTNILSIMLGSFILLLTRKSTKFVNLNKFKSIYERLVSMNALSEVGLYFCCHLSTCPSCKPVCIGSAWPLKSTHFSAFRPHLLVFVLSRSSIAILYHPLFSRHFSLLRHLQLTSPHHPLPYCMSVARNHAIFIS